MSPFGPLLQVTGGQAGMPVVRAGAVWRIGDHVRAAAIGRVAPDVTQVEVVPDLVRRGAALVERRCAVPVVPNAW